MDLKGFGPRPDIIFFDKLDVKANSGMSALKNFLSFLKMQKASQPLRFSFTDSEGSLLPALSLKENISLDSIPSTVSSTKKFTLEDYLGRKGNPFLIELYEKIELVSDLPYQVDSQTRKTAALVKGLLQKADFLFLDCPERYLDKAGLKIFTKALIHSLKENKQTLLLMTDKPSYWTPYITKTVHQSRCAKTGQLLLECIDQVQSPQSLGDNEAEQLGILVFKHSQSALKLPVDSKEESAEKDPKKAA
ncbi:MAG: hypothetical protein K9K67_03955 [Bacteriovoracaceae bacterium]|nr:hypothetical protein [Bacteriovoracaceae bacterium]